MVGNTLDRSVKRVSEERNACLYSSTLLVVIGNMVYGAINT